MTQPFLMGKKVYLRTHDAGDAPQLVAWLNDPEVSRYLLVGQFPMTIESEEEWIRKNALTDKTVILAICIRETKQMIGNIGLMNINWVDRRAPLGLFIGDKSKWSNGYGYEATKLMIDYAFETLNMRRIELDVFDFNDRAHGLYKKLGFVEEGRARQKTYKEGRYIDHIFMGLLREEWVK